MTNEKTSFLTTNKDLLMIAGLGLLVIAIYGQATKFDFINLDDNLYVYNNPALQNGLNWEAVKWAFTSFWSANWHPLTWLSHGLDIQLFGMSPGSHHAVNIVFHLINSILLFVLFRRMTGQEWLSLVVAALFAVHPAHVESVAWISERKDVLSTLFWFLTMLAYVTAVKETGSSDEVPRSAFGTFSSWKYWLVVLFFGLGLMAKPMLVTLPFVLVLCDFWPLDRVQNIRDILPRVVEKLPLFALSAASCVVTFLAQRSTEAVESLDFLPMSTRIMNALVSYAKYVLMLFYPADLAVMYPYDKGIPSWQFAGAIAFLLTVTVVCILQIRKRPFLLMGWLWFLGTLVPVIGVLQVGSQALADRYTYIPYIGLFVMIVWGAASLVSEERFGGRAIQVASVVAVLVLTGFAIRQVSYWRNSETLYKHTLAVTTGNFIIDHNLCHHFLMNDRLDEAEPLCKQAIDIRPSYSEPYNTLGIIEFKRGKFENAEQYFQQSLQLGPGYIYALLNLSQAQARLGKAQEAENSLKQAVDAAGGTPNDSFAAALSSVAAAFAERQDYQKAAENFARLVYLQPNNAEAQTRLAICLYYIKRLDDAETMARYAIAEKPDLADAYYALGLVLADKKQNDQAVQAFNKALQLKPDLTEAQANLDKINSKGNGPKEK
jgi:Flp pilus assembly protein TadD